MIEEYQFGAITIDGRIYNYDIEVRWTGEILQWQRKDSHVIDVDDVRRAVEQKPDTIVIGTGEQGIATISEAAKSFIQTRGIRLIIDRTAEAIKTFNIINESSKEEEGEQDEVIGLFHLTC